MDQSRARQPYYLTSRIKAGFQLRPSHLGIPNLYILWYGANATYQFWGQSVSTRPLYDRFKNMEVVADEHRYK